MMGFMAKNDPEIPGTAEGHSMCSGVGEEKAASHAFLAWHWSIGVHKYSYQTTPRFYRRPVRWGLCERLWYLTSAPFVQNQSHIARWGKNTEFTKTIKRNILGYLDNKYSNPVRDELLYMTSLMDPRFQTTYIDPGKVEQVKKRAVTELLALPADKTTPEQPGPAVEAQPQPEPKKKKSYLLQEERTRSPTTSQRQSKWRLSRQPTCMPQARGSGQACLPCEKCVKMLKLKTASMHIMSKYVLDTKATFYLSTKNVFYERYVLHFIKPNGEIDLFSY